MVKSESSIFISYRRADSAHVAGRLREALAARYGKERVWIDFESIEPGIDFANALDRLVESCAVMLVVIGPQWSKGLDDPEDQIRLEVSKAIQLGTLIVPVLVDGASMPTEDQLPEELVRLRRFNAWMIGATHWEADVAALCPRLDEFLGSRSGLWARLKGWLLPARRPDSGEPGEPESREIYELPVTHSPETERTRHKVFISYADEDRKFVESALEALEERNHPCWVAYRDIKGSKSEWPGAIVRAIANSVVLVVVASKHSMSSKQVLREVNIADEEGVPFVPVCVDESPIPDDFRYFFSTTQRVAVNDLPRPKALERLVESVETDLGGSDGATAPR